MVKVHSSGRMVTSGISDAVITSVDSEKTCLKKLKKMMIVILVNEKKGDVGMDLKSTETRDELSTTCNWNKSSVKMPVSA